MKVISFIGKRYDERGQKAFCNRVYRLLKTQFNEFKIQVEEVVCINAWMERASGYGSYNRVIEIEVDGETHTLREHTNDSEAWDNWHEPTSKDKRRLFEAVLESRIEELRELIVEQKSFI